MVFLELQDIAMHLVILLLQHPDLYFLALSHSLAFLQFPRCSLPILRSA